MKPDKEKQLKIHVVIDGFRIPMNIDRNEEEVYRKAEKQINRYIDDYQKQYPRLSTEEIRSLVAFRLAVVVYKIEYNQNIEPVIDKIRSLDEELDELLNC